MNNSTRNMAILWSVVLPLLLMGCVDSGGENTTPLPEVDAPKYIHASCERLVTRTSVKDDKQTLWNDGDEISYFARQNSNLQYRLQSSSGAQSDYGTFQRITTHCEENKSLKYNYAVYPYNKDVEVPSDGVISLQLPAVQHYAEDSFGKGAATMVAVSDGRDGGMIYFKSAVGYLKLQLYGEDVVVKSIEFRGNSGERLAGAATVSAPYATAPKVEMATSAVNKIVLDCGDGVRIGGSADAPTPFWITIPPQLFADGFTVTILDDKGTSYVKSTSKIVAIDRNFIQPMKPLDVRGNAKLDIEEEEGKVLFYLAERNDGVRAVSGLGLRDWSASRVLLNGKEYEIRNDGESVPYIYADINESGIYNAVLLSENSAQWYGENPYKGVVLPYSQFEMRSIATITNFPMYASNSKTDGRTLLFDDGFALLHLRLRGKGDITSVRVESQNRYDLAGRVAEVPMTGEYKVERGSNFVALNCTNEGTFAPLYGSKYRDFYLMIAPGDYTDGLRLTVCDAEFGAAFYDLTDVNLEAGDVYLIDENYAKSDGLIFYEGFDNCVWGGDIVRGDKAWGFAPDASAVNYNSDLDRTGYEEAFVEVPYNTPGTAFVQSNDWNAVKNQWVGTSHQTTDEYIVSRHFGSTRYLFRAQEYPGYIAVGAATTARGIYNSPIISNMEGVGSFKAKIRFAMQAGFNGLLQVHVVNGGRIVGASLNGAPLTLDTENHSYTNVSSILKINRSLLEIAASDADSKVWHTLELDVADAANGSGIYITDEVVSSGKHGIYIDSIEARQTSEWKRSDTTLRVILWNIQNGMWADQHNNYDNFVEWVKRWDADVCIWCESETIYKDKTNSSTSTKYLPNAWNEVAKRYGHSYVSVGGNRDNYPQTITSKYPITTLNRITDTNVSGKPVSHGAGHFSITVNGQKINIVTLHMWPQAYGYGVTGTANREDSAAKFEGDYYRAFEMQYIVDQTVKNEAYANEELWLFGGDTNARSRLDNWYYGYDENSTKLLVHDILLDQTEMKDVIAHRYPDCFMSSTMGSSRIDIMYASPAMYAKLTNSITLIDKWLSETVKSEYVSSFYDRSDHRPLIMDFDMSK